MVETESKITSSIVITIQQLRDSGTFYRLLREYLSLFPPLHTNTSSTAIYAGHHLFISSLPTPPHTNTSSTAIHAGYHLSTTPMQTQLLATTLSLAPRPFPCSKTLSLLHHHGQRQQQLMLDTVIPLLHFPESLPLNP